MCLADGAAIELNEFPVLSPALTWLTSVMVVVDPWVTLKQSPAYQLAYVGSNGRLFSVGQGRLVAIAYAVIAIGALAVLGPYWHWLGFI